MPEDNLAVNHVVFHDKMDKFIDQRPVLKYFSIRVKKIEHINDEQEHTKNINDTVDQVIVTSIAAKKEAGAEVLAHIRRTILDHAEAFRQDQGTLSADHVWATIKAKQDIHPFSNFKRMCGKQKSLMAMISGDLTAMALIRFLDRTFLAQGLIVADDVISDEHDLMKLDRRSEKALNDLRMLKLS